MTVDILSAIIGFLVVIGIALLLGWTHRRVKSPAAQATIWIGSILVLLAIRFGFTRTWEIGLFLLSSLGHIPAWFLCVAILAGVSYFIALRLANSTVELAQDIERTNARIELLEQSLRTEINDIASRLPERDEPN
jgi:hypothetical protein